MAPASLKQDSGDRADLVSAQPAAGLRVQVHRRYRARLGMLDHVDLRTGPREQQHVRVKQIRKQIQIRNDALDYGGGDAVEVSRDIARYCHRLRSERPAAYV
jgi:hypothetical protein